MEATVKKREWVKTAAIIFLAVLLVLTFFSNTIMNASLPEVAAQQVSSGSINAKIRGSGTIAANETYDVTISQTRKIASVKVKVGQTVNTGDVLFTLEATESDELKQAQDTLTSLERAYEKALLTASTSDAQENREVQKAREAYNEALTIYRQYSTMDAANLAAAQAEADAALKELQRQSKDAQKELTDAQADRDYTEAQANVATLEAKVTELETKYNELVQQVNDYENQNPAQPPMDADYIKQLTDQKRGELNNANAQKDTDWATYGTSYSELVDSVSKGDLLVAETLANDVDYLTTYLFDNFNYKPLTNAQAHAESMAQAYKVIAEDLKRIETLESELEALENMQPSTDVPTDVSLEELKRQRDAAYRELRSTQSELDSTKNAIERHELYIERLEDQVDAISDAVDDQQAEVDKLSSASSAAETVKSTKQALEDLIFAQSLGDTANLDLKDQQEDIEKQKQLIEELTKDADGADVTAKVSGIVSEIHVTAGNTAGADSPLCTINVADRGYTIKIPVTLEQSRRVSVGDSAELVNYWGGDVTATLESIANNPENPGKGKLLVFRLSGEVEPGTTLTLSIGQKSASYDALVPNSAIRTDNNGSFVLAMVAKSTPLSTRYTATRVDVQVLASDDTYTAVSGIGAGEFVITTSTKPIEAGTQVRLVDES